MRVAAERATISREVWRKKGLSARGGRAGESCPAQHPPLPALLTSLRTCSSEDTCSFLLAPGWRQAEASGRVQHPKTHPVLLRHGCAAPPAPAPPALTAPCFSSQASLGRHQEPAPCCAAAANPPACRARPCLAAAAAGDRRGGGGGEGRIHHQSLLQRTSACSASWYRCGEKGTRSAGTTGRRSPAGAGSRGTVPAALCCAPRCRWRWSRAGG